MIEQLASLLLPIDALLHHEDFNPHQEPSSEIVTLFRNMWFLCVLFHFTNANEGDTTAMDWLKPTMSRIAVKTPSMVMEESHDAIDSDVEYNSVIRQEYAHTVRIFATAFTVIQRFQGNFETSELPHGIHRVTFRRHPLPLSGSGHLRINHA